MAPFLIPLFLSCATRKKDEPVQKDLISSLTNSPFQDKRYTPSVHCIDSIEQKAHVDPKKVHVVVASLEYGPYATGGVSSVVNTLTPSVLKLAREKNLPLDVTLLVPFYRYGEGLAKKPQDFCTITHIYESRIVTSKILRGEISFAFQNENIVIPTLFVKPDEGFRDLFDIGSNSTVYMSGHGTDLNSRSFYYTSALAAYVQYGPLNETGDLATIVHSHSYWSSIADLLVNRTGSAHLPFFAEQLHNLNPDQGIIHDYNCGMSPCNLMKATSFASDFLITVSETMVKEGVRPEHHLSFGLNDLYGKFVQSGQIAAIPNGIQFGKWDPDTQLGPYDFVKSHDIARAKFKIKHDYLAKKHFVSDPHKPLFTYVGRYSPEKGIDLLHHAAKVITKLGGSFIIMGVNGQGGDDIMQKIRDDFSDNPNIHVMKGDPQKEQLNSENTGKLVRAASDFVIVPSHEEAFGLVPIEFFTMGTLAITSQVGGMKDYIVEMNTHDTSVGNSFNYDEQLASTASPGDLLRMREEGMEKAIHKAFEYYKSSTEEQRSKVSQRLIQSSKTFDWLAPGGSAEKLSTIYLNLAKRSHY